MMAMLDLDVDSSHTSEMVCLIIAAGLHALALFWNPILLESHFKAAHDFVEIDVVDQSLPNEAPTPEPVKKVSLMDTLKGMLLTPKSEEIAHVAPSPETPRVAAPVQPALREKSAMHSIATMFQPKSASEDLASASAPNQIQTPTRNVATSNNTPSLKAKSFGGIKVADLPFQTGGDEGLAGSNANVIPVAVGNRAAKDSIGYSNPSLKDSSHQHIGFSQKLGGPSEDLSALGAGAPATIALSGTGGPGNAPTGANHGASYQDRQGSGNPLVSRPSYGSGSGISSSISGIPSAAAELDKQLAQTATSAPSRAVKKNGFDIAGPLNNRPIVSKVIPQYPAWAEEQGIIGSVRIYFTVDATGAVRSNMQVRKTTGYPELDKLAMEALKQWQFAPFDASDEDNQWGIITFTFSLAS